MCVAGPAIRPCGAAALSFRRACPPHLVPILYARNGHAMKGRGAHTMADLCMEQVSQQNLILDATANACSGKA